MVEVEGGRGGGEEGGGEREDKRLWLVRVHIIGRLAYLEPNITYTML